MGGLVVIAGSLNIDPVDSTGQMRYSSQIIIHPQYNPGNLNNDISLIRLDSPLELTYNAWPIALPGKSEVGSFYDNEHVVASGWGKTTDYTSGTNQLRFVDMYIEDRQKCINYYGSGTVTDGVICTYTEYGRRSTCNGDSGGPLVLKRTGRLIGCTSFVSTAGCQSGGPDGFTRVAHYLDWIQNYTGVLV